MPPWLEPWFFLALALGVVAVAVTLVVALAALARLLRRTEQLITTVQAQVDRDLPPLVASLRELTDELGRLSRSASSELDRIAQITGRVQEATDATARLLTALSGFTRAGQLVGIAAGVKTGVDVFLSRLRRQRGDGYE